MAARRTNSNKLLLISFILITAMLLCSSSLTLAASTDSMFPHAAAGRTRKVLVRVAKDQVGCTYKEELRTVPSGPDPLHHNGGTPNKKPRPSSP